MIIYNLRTPVETDAKICVGVTGENKSYTTKFLIKELTDKSLTFSIHLKFADGNVNTVVPDSVDVDETGTLITWNVKKYDIFVHGFFDLQIEGRNSSGYVFQTESVRMYADESIPIENKEYAHPNSETIKLREEAYEFLCELKLQQDKFDQNMKQLLATDITKKQDVENLVNDERYITDPKINYPSIAYLDGYYYDCEEIDSKLSEKANFADVNAALAGKAYKSTTLAGYGIKDAYTKTEVDTALKEKQNVQYLNDTVTDINDFIAYNQTNTVYTGRMQGFSKKFGELSDTVAKGFRMWFVLSGADNPTWYRIVLFDDGAVWTAQRSGTTFTQRSYTKNQVDKLLDEKADTADVNTALKLKANFADVQAALAGKAYKSTTLAGYNIGDAYTKTEVDNLLDGIDTTKTEILSGSISSAEQLNNYTDMEKTYLFYVVPPLALSLPVSVGMLCILNNYNNLIQTLRTARYENKIFIREYDSSKGTWSGFTDITVPDNYITKTKLSADLSAEISGKYDASNVESGQGELTYDESINLTDKTFRYQRVGKIATVTMKVAAGENIAANALTLSGLPYINKVTGIYLKILSTKNNDIAVQIPYNTGQIKVISSLATGEALVFTFSYQISY